MSAVASVRRFAFQGFKQNPIITRPVHLLITGLTLWAVYLCVIGVVHWVWLLVPVPLYFFFSLVSRCGLHMLFSHQTYVTYRFWEMTFALVGSLFLLGSTIQWCIGHNTHHVEADNPNDPHNIRGWLNLLLGDYKVPPYTDHDTLERVKNLMRDPFHLYLHRFNMLFCALAIGLIVAIDYRVFLYGYVIPLTAYYWIGGLHNIKSHGESPSKNRAPRNVPWMKWLGTGEYLHKNHHDMPGATSYEREPGDLDLGGRFIELIRIG